MQRWILKQKLNLPKSVQSSLRSNNGMLSLVFSSGIDIFVIILFNICSLLKIGHDKMQLTRAEADLTSI